MTTTDPDATPRDAIETPPSDASSTSGDLLPVTPRLDSFDPTFLDPEVVIRERRERKERSRRSIGYECTRCGRSVGRENLKVKRVQFREMGAGGPVVATRTVAWLCVVPAADGGPSCLESDPDWSREKYMASPGLSDVRSRDGK
jgi:ribosomal protein S14